MLAGGTDCGGSTNTCNSGATPSEKPSKPSLCTSANQGRCECANLKPTADKWADANTYTWHLNGVQRCATIYIPPAATTSMQRKRTAPDEALPTVLCALFSFFFSKRTSSTNLNILIAS